MSETTKKPPETFVEITLDGNKISAPEGSTILDVCKQANIDTPTLCWAENLTPVNVCRVCVVEVEDSRALVPSCSRPIEEGMVVSTESERVNTSRRMVLELLASSVELDRADKEIIEWMNYYGSNPDRMGNSNEVKTSKQPVKIQDNLYVRDYERCILCYKCVEACGEDAQHTFAIATAGRGFEAHISTEFDVELPESACVYCGNCIGVCPTGALVFKLNMICEKTTLGILTTKKSLKLFVVSVGLVAIWNYIPKMRKLLKSLRLLTTPSQRATFVSKVVLVGSTLSQKTRRTYLSLKK